MIYSCYFKNNSYICNVVETNKRLTKKYIMQQDEKQRKKGSGGSRKGAGRKPNYPGPTKEIRITIPIDEENNVRLLIKNYLKNSR